MVRFARWLSVCARAWARARAPPLAVWNVPSGAAFGILHALGFGLSPFAEVKGFLRDSRRLAHGAPVH